MGESIPADRRSAILKAMTGTTQEHHMSDQQPSPKERVEAYFIIGIWAFILLCVVLGLIYG